ncbi:polysaccharide deacetylase family protein [Wenzhouxiangella sp. AB-CW3]|uniref:polysaccharide deacetylase family protein n=1 Tax=Wenzhouxiangella sp. AB-CW3 TaxID=2771012 RepID=UPI00168A592A|nr:polysaccharide deacetylase family protein [Wenzhouxiangella sp. AB-CW3]QOC21913.1 polysaccharide deacetylase family protein [Wenzhouxiangella sp. AB-CW3]
MHGKRFVILSWHSIRVLDNHYADNDLIAFGEDLLTLDAQGWTVLPLAQALAGLDSGTLPDKVAVLTADDGSIMDFEAFDHPSCGPQKSLAQRLREFRDSPASSGRHHPHVSAFAIASPQARDELDRTDYMSLDVWRDDWWAKANESGLISIENHSWDHNHGSLQRTVQRDNRRGDFRWIETESECRAEVDQASDYIERRAGRRPCFFAYPYGQSSEYIRREYLPRYGPELGLQAALACDPEPVTAASDRWHLPRYMFSRDWKQPGDLEILLNDAQAHA